MKVIEATLTTHGIVEFVSREIGKMSNTDPYILNTALYYALGLASGRYVDTSQEPTYREDTEHIAESIYVSPAKPVPFRASPDQHQEESASSLVEYITTHQSVSSNTYATPYFEATDNRNEYAELNAPSYRRVRALAPENSFRFYIIIRSGFSVDRLPTYIRLGSGRGKCRVRYQEVPFETRSGRYKTTHPVSAYDYDTVPEGNVTIEKIPPLKLWLRGEFVDEYLLIKPDSESPTKYPADLIFLKSKR